MAGLVTCGNADVIEGRIHMPIKGAWWADLKLDTGSGPSGAVQVVASGGFTLNGTVTKSGTYLGSTHVRVVAGGGAFYTIMKPASFQNALVRDPLNAILSATGDTASSTILSSVTGALLSYWTITAETQARALDNLTGVAGRSLGQLLNWRVLADGTTWIGQETWPSQNLPTTSDITWVAPVGPRFEIGASTPSLLPGVNLTDVGVNISGVDHWIEPNKIVTWAWQ